MALDPISHLRNHQSYGQFWYGGRTFPGFFYKKNMGTGVRRTTNFRPGGSAMCNKPTTLWNSYTCGGGVGACTASNRSAKRRLAIICNTSQGAN